MGFWGNGKDEAQLPQPQSTDSMWGSMFGGIGPMFRLVGDPEFQRSAAAMMQAVIESTVVIRRVEAKLDALLAGKTDGDPAVAGENPATPGGNR